MNVQSRVSHSHPTDPAVALRRSRPSPQRGQLGALAAIVLAAAIAAFGAGFVTGNALAQGAAPKVANAVGGPRPGEFRLGPGTSSRRVSSSRFTDGRPGSRQMPARAPPVGVFDPCRPTGTTA